VMENYERAKRLLTENMTSLKRLAEALLEKEVLDGSDIDQIITESSYCISRATAPGCI